MIIEHDVFRLADGADESAFLDADRRVQTESAVFAPGFVRRTTARGADGRWLVETLWFDHDSAESAPDQADAAVAHFHSFIDPTSRRTDRFETLD